MGPAAASAVKNAVWCGSSGVSCTHNLLHGAEEWTGEQGVKGTRGLYL